MNTASTEILKKQVRASRGGFTLLEMLIVIGLIAAIIGLTVGALTGIFSENQEKTARLFVKESLETPLMAYRLSMGHYPTSAEGGLQALIKTPPGDKGRWKGPYLKSTELPEDPWGNPYQYKCPGDRNKQSYDVWSYGPGGEGAAEDSYIGNW